MREAWKLAADYYLALKGTISVRVRRADPSTRIAGAVAVMALALMGLHWFNSNGNVDGSAAESASPDDWSLESPDIDDRPTPAGSREPPRSDADAARSPASRDHSGASEGHGATETKAEDSRGHAESDDAMATASASGALSGTVTSASTEANGSMSRPTPSEADPPASQPSADDGTEPGQECPPGTGLVTGLLGGVLCLADDLL